MKLKNPNYFYFEVNFNENAKIFFIFLLSEKGVDRDNNSTFLRAIVVQKKFKLAKLVQNQCQKIKKLKPNKQTNPTHMFRFTARTTQHK